MRQKYYCPNCGAPVVCGERFCISCGINFTWIAQPEPAQPASVSYKLPGAERREKSADYQAPYDQSSREPAYGDLDSPHVAELKSAQPGNMASPLSTEISKLLETFFDRHARCK
jgi:uncharacterized Zn finger protein (UPF0148 family)